MLIRHMNKKARVGVVGAGWWSGRVHLSFGVLDGVRRTTKYRASMRYESHTRRLLSDEFPPVISHFVGGTGRVPRGDISVSAAHRIHHRSGGVPRIAKTNLLGRGLS
jgi:hypothetical protein